jgi:cell division transport system ATP-binding protein
VGPSAAGKTTLLKLLHGELRAQRGALLVDGSDLIKARGRTRRQLRRRVAVVFQDYRLLRRLTVAENVVYALRVADLWLPRREALRRATAALEAVGIAERARAFPHQISGGQQQRLAIARAVAARPAILLADEPTASLDRAEAKKILSLFESVARAGTTVLVATHDAGLVAKSRRRVIALREGRVASDRVLQRSA